MRYDIGYMEYRDSDEAVNYTTEQIISYLDRLNDAARFGECCDLEQTVWVLEDVLIATITGGGWNVAYTATDPSPENGPLAREYANEPTPFPPIVLERYDKGIWSVIDGCRRCAAATLRGDITIKAFIPKREAQVMLEEEEDAICDAEFLDSTYSDTAEGAALKQHILNKKL